MKDSRVKKFLDFESSKRTLSDMKWATWSWNDLQGGSMELHTVRHHLEIFPFSDNMKCYLEGFSFVISLDNLPSLTFVVWIESWSAKRSGTLRITAILPAPLGVESSAGQLWPGKHRTWCGPSSTTKTPHPQESKDMIYPTPFCFLQRTAQQAVYDTSLWRRLLVPNVWIAGHR
jgi:hypothetical protein